MVAQYMVRGGHLWCWTGCGRSWLFDAWQLRGLPQTAPSGRTPFIYIICWHSSGCSNPLRRQHKPAQGSPIQPAPGGPNRFSSAQLNFPLISHSQHFHSVRLYVFGSCSRELLVLRSWTRVDGLNMWEELTFFLTLFGARLDCVQTN